MYPFKFANIYFEKVWGGRDFETFRDNLIEGDVGESWDVACHDKADSIVINGEYNGISLANMIKEHGSNLLGTSIDTDKFPLLVKLINARENLSVQVHPNNDYANQYENELGKTEVWYVINAEEDSELIIGTKDCNYETFEASLQSGKLLDHVNRIKIHPGEVYFVKSGLVHAIGSGTTIAEIQQNSDTTYRLYDYSRGRDIHVDQALQVVDLNLIGDKSQGITVNMDGYKKTYYCLCDEFSLESYEIMDRLVEESDPERFYIFTCVAGEGKIESKDIVEDIKMGDSIMIPATMGEYMISGEGLRLLKSYVPDIDKVTEEIISIIKK